MPYLDKALEKSVCPTNSTASLPTSHWEWWSHKVERTGSLNPTVEEMGLLNTHFALLSKRCIHLSYV